MKTEEDTKQPFIEIGNMMFEQSVYKSELAIGNITIRFEQRFNWLNRLMFKIFFGLNITNIRK